MRAKSVVTIGVFDGVHRGHQKILKAVAKIARQKRAKAVAVTFSPHPLAVLFPKKPPPLLISLEHRIRLMRRFGIDRCVVFEFTKEFARIRAESFLKDILVKRLNAGWVVAGEDFCFGKQRRGGRAFLRKLADKYGFSATLIKPLKFKGSVISSSLIRRLILKGRLRLAEKLLGRPVTILGTVARGKNIGRDLGFPTANINPHHEAAPPSGVYAVFVRAGKKIYSGILNIGIRPTFYGPLCRDEEPTIEAHIFDFSGNLYGRDIEVEFVKRIRPEKKFAGREELIRQINKDARIARKILREA